MTKLLVCVAVAWLGCVTPSLSRPVAADHSSATDARRLEAVLDPLITAGLKSSGAPGAGVVVVHHGRVVLVKGYGEADREAHAVSTARTVWPIASITKVVTALAVMQQVERGRMRLDADLGSYLKDLRIPVAYGRPITLADVLDHTSGLDELPGRQLDGPEPARPLSAFLQGRLIRYRAPGDYASYSTYGMALAGAALEDVSGEDYAGYVKRRIFAPLGATASRIMIRRQDATGLAAAYALNDGKATRIAYEWYATPPTSSAVMSLDDMARLLLDLTSARPRLLSRPTLDLMMAQHSTLSPQVPGWGYGFQLDRANGRRIAEHGGDIGGFASLMSILPDEELAIFTVSHGEGSSLRFRVRKAVLDALFPSPPPVAPPVVAVDLAPYLGVYRASFRCHTCATPSNVPEFAVAADPQGGLSLWGTRWLPVGADTFVDPQDGRRIVFLRAPTGEVTTVTGGSWRVGERVAGPGR